MRLCALCAELTCLPSPFFLNHRLGDYARAVDLFTTAVALEDSNADFYHNRGFSLRKMVRRQTEAYHLISGCGGATLRVEKPKLCCRVLCPAACQLGLAVVHTMAQHKGTLDLADNTSHRH